MDKEAQKFHILTDPVRNVVSVGTINKTESKRLGGKMAVSYNKVERTDEFWKALIDMYENSTWVIDKKDKETNEKTGKYYCMVLDEEKLEKYKDKPLGEILVDKNERK